MKAGNLLWGVVASAALVISGSCKDVAGPAPVESITVSETALDLVPGETAHLSAVARDVAGEPLSRPISWSSSTPAVATVDNGVVSAVAAGDATITASAEGKSTTLGVTVEDGGLVGPAGGTISAIGGIVQLSVPPTAVLSTSRLLIRPASDYPMNSRLVRGSSFELRTNPSGGSSAQSLFTQPVVLTIRYDPADVGQKPEAGLSIYRVIGSGWQQLDESTVNTASHTVSTRVTTLGVYGILTQSTVASVEVVPDGGTVRVREKLTFQASMRDADGTVLAARIATWTSSSPSVAVVDVATGEVTGVAPGNAVITATSEGISAQGALRVTAGAAARITKVAGDGQTALPGTTLPVAPSVMVTDADGFAVPGVAVTFSVTTGGGSITGAEALTDEGGVARVGSWTLGGAAGSNILSAIAAGTEGSPILFTATAQLVAPPPAPNGPPAAIAISTGDGQVAPAGTAVPISPAVKVTDASGKSVSGVFVTFSIRSGGGSLTGEVAVSDANGIATVGSWTLGAAPGGNSLFATLQGVAGSPLIFVATGSTGGPPGPPPPPPPPSGPAAAIAMYAGDGQTAITGFAVAIPPAVRVTDAAGVPVAGVTVSFSIRSGDGSLTQPSPISDANGIATVGSWILGAPGGNSIFATVNGLAGSPVIFVATSTLPPGSGVRVVTLGDSNTDVGWAGTDPTVMARSYVSSSEPRLSPSAPNSPYQLAGKIEAKWRAQSSKSIVAVNHGISATSTGEGRTPPGAPNARTEVGAVTRFAGEALGASYPWSGGEPTNGNYPNGAIARVLAFSPGANDFVYVSMGTNDPDAGLTAAQTSANLEWMLDQWVGTGHATNHFILTTLAPSSLNNAIPGINTEIRALAARRGIYLVDLAGRTSDNNGATWRNPAADTIGDGLLLHYSEAVRDWLGDQVVAYMLTLVPK